MSSKDFPDSLTPFVTIIHSNSLLDYILFPYGTIVDKLLLVGQHLYVRVKDNVTYEFSLHLQQSCMPCSSYLDDLEMGDRWP